MKTSDTCMYDGKRNVSSLNKIKFKEELWNERVFVDTVAPNRVNETQNLH